MSINLLSFEADELLNAAIMSKTPILIVEGMKDIQVYEKLSLSINKRIDVIASENIKEVSLGKEGCNGVIESLIKIENTNYKNYDKYILGIIDRDVRVFRNEINYLPKGVYILKNYSIETDFINSNNISYLLDKLTSASLLLIESRLNDEIYTKFEEKLMQLYYVGLDALKNACDSTYISMYKYSDSIIKIIKEDFNNQLANRVTYLNNFARERNIEKNIENLLLILKGKWVLDYFVFSLKKDFMDLPTLCKNGEIKQCQYCIMGKNNKCLYKLVTTYNDVQVKTLVLSNIDHGGLEYIKDKLNTLI